MPGKSGQRTHDQNGPFNAHRVEVFLPYEAVVDRLEGAAKQLAGASVFHRGGLAILRLGAASTSDDNDSRPEVWLQGGVHANEWIGPAVVLRLMDEIVRNSELRARATWYLLPVVDAHGYKRTWAGERGSVNRCKYWSNSWPPTFSLWSGYNPSLEESFV